MTNTRIWFGAVLIGLSVAGCSDLPLTSAPAGEPQFTASSAAGRKPVVRPNSVRYRDTAKKPWTGRSGSATVSAMALLGKDGSVELLVQAGAPGVLERVQIRAVSPAGRQLSVTNHNQVRKSSATFPVQGGLETRWQIQANITGVDHNRTNVVDVTAGVLRRPDLAVTAIQHSTATLVGANTTIIATVRELNGDLGATANCRLLVNGAQVDQASGIYVDSNGNVTCAFSHAFASVGTKQLEVRVTDVQPQDYDVTNNAMTSTISVVTGSTGGDTGDNGDNGGPPPIAEYTAFFWDASARDLRETVSVRHQQRIEEPGRVTVQDYTKVDQVDERATSIRAYSFGGEVTFPLRFQIREHTAGSVVHELDLQGMTQTWTETQFGVTSRCTQWWQEVLVGGTVVYPANVNVCAESGAGVSRTRIEHQRYTGEVMYLSGGLYYAWIGTEYVDYSHVITSSSSASIPGNTTSFGNDYRWEVTVSTPTQVFRFDRTITVAPFNSTVNAGPDCGGFDFPSYKDEWCITSSTVRTGRMGARIDSP